MRFCCKENHSLFYKLTREIIPKIYNTKSYESQVFCIFVLTCILFLIELAESESDEDIVIGSGNTLGSGSGSGSISDDEDY